MFDIIGGPATHVRPLITWQPDIAGRSYADIVAYTRPPEERHAGAWFDVYYTHKTVSDHTEYSLTSQRVTYQAIEQVATLPAPPVIPAEDRLAALPEPTLAGWSQEQIQFIGGPEAALELVASRQRIAVENDRSLDIFDWEAAARIYTGILETIAPRKLTASQRALVGQARVLEAEEELDSARRSLAKLKTNAGQPQTPGEPAGPGRPSTGDPVKANLPPAHIAQLDALAEARGTTRAALVRAAVASYLLTEVQQQSTGPVTPEQARDLYRGWNQSDVIDRGPDTNPVTKDDVLAAIDSYIEAGGETDQDGEPVDAGWGGRSGPAEQ